SGLRIKLRERRTPRETKPLHDGTVGGKGVRHDSDAPLLRQGGTVEALPPLRRRAPALHRRGFVSPGADPGPEVPRIFPHRNQALFGKTEIPLRVARHAEGNFEGQERAHRAGNRRHRRSGKQAGGKAARLGGDPGSAPGDPAGKGRSEERRVGKECRWAWSGGTVGERTV